MEIWNAFKLSHKEEIKKIFRFPKRFGWLCIVYVIFAIFAMDRTSIQVSAGLAVGCLGALTLCLSFLARAGGRQDTLFQEFKTRHKIQQSGN